MTSRKRSGFPAHSRNGTHEKAEAEIARLRKRLDTIDERIVSLLANRQQEVERIVTLKRMHNLPVYHPAREEDLISKRRGQGVHAGLDPDYVESLYRRILKQSRKEQSAHLAQKGVRAGATVLIVGGDGNMGAYFRKWFEAAHYQVRILGRTDWSRVDALCKDVDLVIMSVPIDVTARVVHEIGPHLPPNCILTDITSIKKVPLKAMLDIHEGPVVGLHPLFGPTTSTMDKQIVVVTPGRNDTDCQWLLDQFSAWGNILVYSDAAEHDLIMGMVQALRHFATFAFGQFLRRKKIDLHRTLEFSSPIYRLELVMVGRLFAQDPALYGEIIFASPQRSALLAEYLDSLMTNRDMLKNEDKELFCEEFKKTADWFASFSEQAIRESSFLIDKLIERF